MIGGARQGPPRPLQPAGRPSRRRMSSSRVAIASRSASLRPWRRRLTSVSIACWSPSTVPPWRRATSASEPPSAQLLAHLALGDRRGTAPWRRCSASARGSGTCECRGWFWRSAGSPGGRCCAQADVQPARDVGEERAAVRPQPPPLALMPAYGAGDERDAGASAALTHPSLEFDPDVDAGLDRVAVDRPRAPRRRSRGCRARRGSRRAASTLEAPISVEVMRASCSVQASAICASDWPRCWRSR